MLRFLLPLAAAAFGVVPRLSAEPAAGQAEIVAVRFSLVTPAAAAGPWLEADVQLETRPGPDDPGRMLRNVRVTLQLGTEVPAASRRRTEYYQAEATAIALAAGRSDVRFYLPPELVRRDGVRGEPRDWHAELAVAGQPLPAARGRSSAALQGAAAQREFAARIAAEAAPNDGLLQPQYLTPFAFEYPAATPTFVRREARR